MRTCVLAILMLLGCGKSDDAKSGDKPSTSETKPVEPSPEQKKMCADVKQAASAAWTEFGKSATMIANFQESQQLPLAQKKSDQASKEKPYSKDAMFVDELKAKVEATRKDVDALKAAIASYKTAADVAAKTSTEVAGATRDAKPAADRAAAAARDAREAGAKEVTAYFDEANDGPGRAIGLMKKAIQYDPTPQHKAEAEETTRQVGAMQNEVMQRHTDVYKLADTAIAASKKIDDACKGIP
jgi:hypothetical protein